MPHRALLLLVATMAPACAMQGIRSTDPAAPAETSRPEPTVPDDWASFTDPARGISFRYPAELATQYIRPVDWPPQPAVERGPFRCTEAGSETARAGRTARRTIRTRTYCVTRVTEGAAGSLYTLYAYAFPSGHEVVILTFSLRAVQCGNYDEPQRSACERERAAFSMDPIIDRVAGSLQHDSTSPKRESG